MKTRMATWTRLNGHGDGGDNDEDDGDNDDNDGDDVEDERLTKAKMTMTMMKIRMMMTMMEGVASTEAKPIFQDNPSRADLKVSTYCVIG